MNPDLDVDRLLSDVATEIAMSADDSVKAMIFGNQRLQDEIQGLQADARKCLLSVRAGEHGAVDKLALTLRSRKTAIVAACPEHAFSVERLVARAVQKILEASR